MATIRKRGGRYNVQIRKLGYRSITKTFTHIAVARKWAAFEIHDVSQARNNCITTLYMLCHLRISQIENTSFYGRCVWVFHDIGWEFMQ
jgi:hypothetical protein